MASIRDDKNGDTWAQRGTVKFGVTELQPERSLTIELGGGSRVTYTSDSGVGPVNNVRIGPSLGAQRVAYRDSTRPESGAGVTSLAVEDGGGTRAHWIAIVMPGQWASGAADALLNVTELEPSAHLRDASSGPREVQPLPACRCGEFEEVVRDELGRLASSSCTARGASAPRLRITHDEHGFPVRLDEQLSRSQVVTLPRAFTETGAGESPRTITARQRSVRLTWSPETGLPTSVVTSFDGLRQGPAFEVSPAPDIGIRVSYYRDDLPTGLWFETDRANALHRAYIPHDPPRVDVDVPVETLPAWTPPAPALPDRRAPIEQVKVP